MATARFEIKEWNAERLLGRTTQILEDFAPIIAAEARTQLTTVKWRWPNPTVRFKSLYQGGEQRRSRFGRGVYIPAGERDIVDTGELLNSQQAPQVQRNVLSIAWTAPYARQVLEGSYPEPYVGPLGYQVAAPGKKPPRDWISAALVAEPFQPFFVRRWRELAQ
jgi:hypothetical protein